MSIALHIGMSHVTHMNESCHTYEWVMSHIRITNEYSVTHRNEFCCICVWVLSHMGISKLMGMTPVWHSFTIVLNMRHLFISFRWMSDTQPFHFADRPTQSIMYVPLQVKRFKKIILLIVQYKYLKSCSRRFYCPESDPPHKIMRYNVYYSSQMSFWFPPDRICQVEMICIGGVTVLKRHFGGAGP